MTTINETVETAMNQAGLGSYSNHVGPVITALVNREQETVGRLIQVARESDLDTDAVRNTLAECGFHMPVEPVAATEAATPSDVPASVEQMLANIQAGINAMTGTVNGLVQFARNNGYQG